MAEHNLIQAPELIRRLTKRLGLRQPHIAPTLNEGVQSVVVLDDLRDTPEPTVTEFIGAISGTSDLNTGPVVGILNPVGSGILVRLLRALWSSNDYTGPSWLTMGALQGVEYTSIIMTASARGVDNRYPYGSGARYSHSLLQGGKDTGANNLALPHGLLANPTGFLELDLSGIVIPPDGVFRFATSRQAARTDALTLMWLEETLP